MNQKMRWFHDLAGNIYIAFFGAIASIIGLIWLLVASYDSEEWRIPRAIFAFTSLILFLVVAVYSIAVRKENIQFRKFIKILHRVNHDYRDALCTVFKNPSSTLTEAEFLNFVKQNERQTVKSVCQKIEKIYNALANCECTVTVKLITTVDGRAFCETYERSEANCERDAGQPRTFELNTGENTAFDRALMYAPGTVSRFHSADLSKEKNYRNQRSNYLDFYESTIVVPIRSVNPMRIGNKDCSHDMGFLCVDTLSINRLNDDWHIELMAAFADQMYNFLSLTRGTYSLKDSDAGTTR